MRSVQEGDEILVQDLFDFGMHADACRLFVMSCLHDGAIHELFFVSNVCIGMVSLDHGEISYRMKKAWRGQGFGTQCVALFLQHNVTEMKARVEADNAASIAILKANGFKMNDRHENVLYFTRDLQAAGKIAKVGW